MQDSSGTFIVLEGADGSGKKTQFNLLRERLRAVGHDVAVFDFPRYENESSYFVRQYLAGAYGPATAISPYTASIFYALDRYEATPQIRAALNSGKVVLSNRFVGANMAHQGSKITDPLEQRSFFVWEDSMEFQLLKIPRPILNIFLRVPAEISMKLIEQRAAKTGKKLDEHEKDIEHLRKSVETYDLLCQLFPTDFKAVECTENGKLLTIPEINNRIWDVVKPLLPGQPARKAKSVTFKLDEVGEQVQAESQKTKQSKDVLDFRAQGVSLAALLDINAALPNTSSPELAWHRAGYKYLTPQGLQKKTAEKYKLTLDSIVESHKKMVEKLKKHGGQTKLLEPAVPLAATFDLRLELTAEAARQLIRQLGQSKLGELKDITANLAAEAHKLWPKDFDAKASSDSSAPEPLGDILNRLAKETLSQNLSGDTEPVTLLESWPRNEFKALADSLYALSNLPRERIEAELDDWPYQQKHEALVKAVKSANSPLKHVRYHFDIIADRQSLGRLQAQTPPEELHIQPVTPRYGYDVPGKLGELEIEDDYMDCFDKSLELYSMLQITNREEIVEYGCLLGNKTRAQLVCSAAWLQSLPWATFDSRERHLLLQLVEKVSEAHPAIGSTILESIQHELKPAKKPSHSRAHRRKKA